MKRRLQKVAFKFHLSDTWMGMLLRDASNSRLGFFYTGGV